MSYTRGYDTQYRCSHCNQKFSEDELVDWKCPKCNDYIQIAAPDLQIGESVYLTGLGAYKILNINEARGQKLRIALKKYRSLTSDEDEYFNVINGGYFEKDWVSENEESDEQ